MAEFTYTLALVEDKKLLERLQNGADESTVADAVGAAREKLEVVSEVSFEFEIFDNVARCSWSDSNKLPSGVYRLVNADECENGATRLSDLLEEPRKLARGMAHLLAEESEVELHEDDIVVLTEFLAENDTEVEISRDSSVETFGLYMIQLAQALQAAADHDAWLLAVTREG